MDSEPMEVDDAGNPLTVTIAVEPAGDTSGTSSTELNDSDNTSMTSGFCPHCSRSLSPLSQNDARTHPESLAIAHAEWSELKTNLYDALMNKFDKSFYAVVEALLLTWAANDLGPNIEKEAEELCSVFQDDYNFQAKHHIIPSVNPSSRVQKLLANKIADLEDKSEDNRTLLIVYYDGHGARKHDKLIWAARRAWNLNSKEYPALEWYPLQRMLEDSKFDVLLILDCCHAGGAVTKSSNTTMEVIAACGREVTATGPGGSHPTGSPFTQTLIKHLRSLAKRPHGLLITELQSYMSLDETLKDQSPNHVVLMGHYNPIILRKLSLNASDPPDQQEQLQGTLTTKVLLSICLRNNTLLMVEEWVQWLSSFHPRQVAGVEVEDVMKVPVKAEAAFSSGSTLLLLSMPMFIWARLRPHPAYTFVGFIKSSDFLKEMVFAPKTGISQDIEAPVAIDPPLPHLELPTITR